MAKNTTNETGTEQPQAAKGPRILKHGLLAAPANVAITGAPSIGRFGKLEIPLDLDGQKFILPIAETNPELDALRLKFGSDMATWVGCRVMVADGKVLKQVTVRPIADAKGRPVS
jgi:hypothetical protein